MQIPENDSKSSIFNDCILKLNLYEQNFKTVKLWKFLKTAKLRAKLAFSAVLIWLNLMGLDPNIFWGHCFWPPPGFFLGSFLPWIFCDSFYTAIHIVISLYQISFKMILLIFAEVKYKFLYDFICNHHCFYHWNNLDKLLSTITKNSALAKILRKVRPNIYQSLGYSTVCFGKK